MSETERACNTCGVIHPVEHYRTNSKGYRLNKCRACQNIQWNHNRPSRRVRSYNYGTGKYLTQLLRSKWSLGLLPEK